MNDFNIEDYDYYGITPGVPFNKRKDPYVAARNKQTKQWGFLYLKNGRYSPSIYSRLYEEYVYNDDWVKMNVVINEFKYRAE